MGTRDIIDEFMARLRATANGTRALITTGVVSGLLVAALVFPVLAAGGLSAKATAEAIERMSVDLEEVEPPQTTYVYAADGTTLISLFYDEFRRHVDLPDIAPVMQQAIIAAEDSRFYDHNGVDAKSIIRAAMANRSSGDVEQGASTLTMQYVRGALRLSADTAEEALAATEQTPERKVREMRLAIAVEERLSKDEILERYLNQAYFGHNAYGVYAAAYVYFSKSPADLTLAESALLAGLVQAPSEYDPAAGDPTAATDRRNWVIDQMVENDHIAAAEAEEVRSKPIELDLSYPPNTCMGDGDTPAEYGFFCDFLLNWWRRQPAFGDTPAERETNLRQGGYTIITSLDPDLQDAATDEVTDAEPASSSYAHGLVTVEPGTGRVTTMAVNRNFSMDQSDNGYHTQAGPGYSGMRGNYPNTVNSLLGGGAVAGYQAGSTFKMFTMLAALESGMPLSTAIQSPNQVATQYPVASGPASCGGVWCPSNANSSMAGNRNMWSGFGMSVNTYFAQLIQRVGADKVVAMAERLGLEWRSESDAYYADPVRSEGWGAFTLGVADTTPMEMAAAFATIAADGKYCAPNPILKIIDTGGQELTDGAPQCRKELDTGVARAATDAARCVTGDWTRSGVCGAWSTAQQVRKDVGRPVAGKTGTTDNNRAAWFVGYTPQLAAASFVADPDNPFRSVGNGRTSMPRDTASFALREGLEGEPVEDFKGPPKRLVSGGD